MLRSGPGGAVGGVVGAALAEWSVPAVPSPPVLAVVNVWLPLTGGGLPKVSPEWRGWPGNPGHV